MIQEYRDLLIHINVFEEAYTTSLENMYRLQELYYRYTLDYLSSKYNLFLLGDKDINIDGIASKVGIKPYVEKIYIPSDDYKKVYENILMYRPNKGYLVIGKNYDNELDDAYLYKLPTCLVNNDFNCSFDDVTYKIDSFQKIKTIL